MTLAEREEAEHSDLILHNAEFDRWEDMTDAERDQEISAALRRAS